MDIFGIFGIIEAREIKIRKWFSVKRDISARQCKSMGVVIRNGVRVNRSSKVVKSVKKVCKKREWGWNGVFLFCFEKSIDGGGVNEVGGGKGGGWSFFCEVGGLITVL